MEKKSITGSRKASQATLTHCGPDPRVTSRSPCWFESALSAPQGLTDGLVKNYVDHCFEKISFDQKNIV